MVGTSYSIVFAEAAPHNLFASTCIAFAKDCKVEKSSPQETPVIMTELNVRADFLLTNARPLFSPQTQLILAE
jgi:hypothetical protein